MKNFKKYPEQFYPKYISIKKVTVNLNKNYLLNKNLTIICVKIINLNSIFQRDGTDFGSGEGEFLDMLKTKK